MRKSYDHRLKQQVIDEGDPSLVLKYGGNIHSSRNWIYRGIPEYVSSGDHDIEPKNAAVKKLEKKIRDLEKERDLYKAKTRLLENTNKIVQINLHKRHITDKSVRKKILAEVDI